MREVVKLNIEKDHLNEELSVFGRQKSQIETPVTGMKIGEQQQQPFTLIEQSQNMIRGNHRMKEFKITRGVKTGNSSPAHTASFTSEDLRRIGIADPSQPKETFISSSRIGETVQSSEYEFSPRVGGVQIHTSSQASPRFMQLREQK